MQISSATTGISSIAAQSMPLREEQIQEEVNVKLLAESLKIQEDTMTNLLKSMGIGGNVDVVA